MNKNSAKVFRILLSIFLLFSFMQPSHAITSLSELKIPDDEFALITSKYSELQKNLTPIIEKTTFAQEEFLRVRAESKGVGPEFQAARNFLRNQIKSLFQSFSVQSKIKLESDQLYRKILKSP
ncbi:MAG TPA: hypothetical protein DCP55_07280, partial [Chitinophagaceae bacterium]|nr:hypothetical protein [Chitinophagaceae bacterium]